MRKLLDRTTETFRPNSALNNYGKINLTFPQNNVIIFSETECIENEKQNRNSSKSTCS